MRLYDENGICIGSVREKNLRNSEESIMPVSITVTPAKHLVLPNGYILMAVAGVVAVLSLLLSIISEIFDFPDVIVTFLSMLGLCGTDSHLFVPLAILIQFTAILLLGRVHLLFLYAGIYYAFMVYGDAFYVITPPVSWGERNWMYIADIMIILAASALCYVVQEKIHISIIRIPYYWIIIPVRLFVTIILFVFAPDAIAGWIIAMLYYLFEIVYWAWIDAYMQKKII